MTATCMVTELAPAPPDPPVPVPLDDVLPPQDTSPADRTSVRVISRKPRVTTAMLSSRRRPKASIARVAISQTAANAALHPTGRAYPGRPREEGAETNMLLVGVPTREIVRVSVLPWAGLRGCGEKLQVSQPGNAAPVSAFMQEKVIGPERPLGLSVTVKLAEALDADRLAELGETEPVGKLGVAKLRSATALPLAWFTQTISGVEFASTPIWTVPQVETSGVVGSAPVP